MPLPPLLPLAAVLCCCGLSACSSDQASTPPAITNAPRLIGRIGSVSADRRFVAIQSYGNWAVAAGTVLTTRGPDARTANLLVTGESLGRFAAADVQAGMIEVGDAVYGPAATALKPADAPAETPPAPETPANKPSEPLSNKPIENP
ncbi:MAG: hypothetical protein RLZZ522_1324 [Verrucomicrobiota bacterium]|jgi:hypothetical protein